MSSSIVDLALGVTSSPAEAAYLKRVEALMSELVGKPLAVYDLDPNQAEDYMLFELATQYDHQRRIVRERAASIARDMQRVAAGSEPTALADCSDSRQYDAAVAALNALRKPLETVAGLYREAADEQS